MTALNPANDRLAVYSESLSQHAEVTPAVVVKAVLVQGANTAISYDAGSGTVTIAGPASSLPANATGYLYDNGSGSLSWQPFPVPVVGNVSATVNENTSNNSIALSLTTRHYSKGFVIDSGPSHGTLTLSGSSVLYTPTTGYTGGDSFTYHAYNIGGNSNKGTGTITVGVTTAAPVTSNGSMTLTENTSSTINLATLTSGSATSWSITSNPTHGTVSISGSTATYTPNTGYVGSDNFTFHATGPGGVSNVSSVSETVNAAASGPTANPGTFTTVYDEAVTGSYISGFTYNGGAGAVTSASYSNVVLTPPNYNTTGYNWVPLFAVKVSGATTGFSSSLQVNVPPQTVYLDYIGPSPLGYVPEYTGLINGTMDITITGPSGSTKYSAVPFTIGIEYSGGGGGGG